ncbi:hypothetical protein H8B02_30850 [Bradyrhizobium sp. Pear77]|nr:hypothetical protein [Bradyrhizobium altum]
MQLAGQKRFSKLGGSFLLAFSLRQRIRERVTLFFHCTKGFGDGELLSDLTRLKLGLQLLDFGILGGRGPLQIAADLGLGQFHSVLLFPLGQFQPLVQLSFEVAVADLTPTSWLDARNPCSVAAIRLTGADPGRRYPLLHRAPQEEHKVVRLQHTVLF